MPHHALIETTIRGEQTRTWFCPLCRFTCHSARSLPSLMDQRRHFLLRLMTVEQEVREALQMPETAKAIKELIDRAAEEMEGEEI